MQFEFADFNEDFKPEDTVVNSKAIVKKKGNTFFTDDGIYSEEIFGKMHGESIDYSCKCKSGKKRFGKFLEGTLCNVCNTRVVMRESNIEKMGWMDLVYPVINPIFFSFIEKLVGKTALDKIIKFDKKLSLNGNIEDVFDETTIASITKIDDLNSIGLTVFIKHFDVILNLIESKNLKHARNLLIIELLRKNRSKVIVKVLPIISHRLRPAIMRGDDITFDKINNIYCQLISANEVLVDMSTSERDSISVLQMIYSIQTLANQLSASHLSAIKSKGGWLRSNLMANRLNFTARMVIVPNDVEGNLDDIEIPYLAGVELFRFHIINILVQLRNINYTEAQNLWAEACFSFNEDIYMIIEEILAKTKGGQYCLLNRNPTISFGSILRMKVGKVKKDYNDFTMGVPNNVLKFLGGDYDGDVLSIFLLLDRDMVKHYEKFSPKHLVVSVDDGCFNNALAIDKDNALGFYSMVV
jgi:DNA-directed RNA polymerase beta' subunit